MSIYLKDIPLQKAQQALNDALCQAGLAGILGIEHISLNEQAAGRVLAEAIWAPASSPHYHASAMDGFALRSEDTLSALPSRPVTLSCPSQANPIDTGDPLPEWADTVIPIEDVEILTSTGEVTLERKNPTAIRIRSAMAPWTHIRPMGEDIVATQLVLPAGIILRPVDLGALAACGCHTLPVHASRALPSCQQGLNWLSSV
jgi:putative molybdopterin biosynthesis protein